MAAGGAAVVLLDLDDTLVYEQRTVPGILVTAARLAERRRGVPATELAAALRQRARRRWRALPVHPFAQAVGISSATAWSTTSPGRARRGCARCGSPTRRSPALRRPPLQACRPIT